MKLKIFFSNFTSFYLFCQVPFTVCTPSRGAFLWRTCLCTLPSSTCQHMGVLSPGSEAQSSYLAVCWLVSTWSTGRVSFEEKQGSYITWCYSSTNVPSLPAKLTSEFDWHNFLTNQDIHSWISISRATDTDAWAHTYPGKIIVYVPVYKMD